MFADRSGWLKSIAGYEMLSFLPLLILYLFLTVIFSSNTFIGDEGGYFEYANHLLNGRYSTRDHITLWWGPGYPIVLAPFIFFNLPLLAAKLLNPFFIFGAIVYFYKTLNLYTSKKYSIILAYCMGMYPPLIREVHLLLTESLVFLLVCGFMFHFCKLYKKPKSLWLHLLAASTYLGYLALTKIFFGYVILAGLSTVLFLFVWQRKDCFRKTVYVYVLALVWCAPYLIFTYSLTGKIFYWGTSGGSSLYWMSTPYKNELGSWFDVAQVQKLPALSPHRDFFYRLAGLSEVARDDALKKKAIDNIAHHPRKYFINFISNIGRLLFSYPFSFTPQKLSTYFYILPNMFIVVLFTLSIYPAILRWQGIPYEIYMLLLFAIFAFGGFSLLAAYNRQFQPLAPIVLLWIYFIYTRVLKIEVRSESEISFAENNPSL